MHLVPAVSVFLDGVALDERLLHHGGCLAEVLREHCTRAGLAISVCHAMCAANDITVARSGMQ
jgi:hypothetical protein